MFNIYLKIITEGFFLFCDWSLVVSYIVCTVLTIQYFMSSFLIVHELTFHFTWSKSFSKSTKGEVSSQVPFLVFFLQLTWSEYFISCISIRYEFNLHVMVFQVRCTWIILVRGCNFFWLVFLQKDESWFSIISLLSNLSFLMSKFVLATFSIISVLIKGGLYQE